MRIRVLDLDGAMTSQLERLGRIAPVERVDLTDLGSPLRLWARPRHMRAFSERLAEVEKRANSVPMLTFLGSGDYHHLSAALIAAAAREPLAVIHFDNHPDWVRFAPSYHCGSWINRVLALRAVQQVITLGPCSDDLERPQLKGGNLRALASGRLEIHPWRRPPSAVWGRYGAGPSYRQSGRYLHWHNLADEDWPGFLRRLVRRLRTAAVWITIDKDVLAPVNAATNWDQGEMPLERLLLALRVLAAKRILGVDVCGDYSPPRFGANIAKRWEARCDHAPPPEPADLARNIATNEAIATALRDALS